MLQGEVLVLELLAVDGLTTGTLSGVSVMFNQMEEMRGYSRCQQ